ncbi:MAG: hypothetical protein IKO20_05100 [Bacteroidaceae bacterium]|nr:hypothetical protein [Bacteroidaceae bacterium]
MTDLLAAAVEIRDAQQAGENTADRVGSLIVNIIGELCRTLPAAGITLKANAAGTGITVSYYTEEGTPVNRDVILPVATTTFPGLLSTTDKKKLEGFESGIESAQSAALLASGAPAVVKGCIDGHGAWQTAIQGFNDCLIVPIEPNATVAVTYSEEVSVIDRSFFNAYNAATKAITFADGYNGNVSNSGTYTIKTYTAPDNARFFYTAYNHDKIVSIKINGKEVFADMPAERLLHSENNLTELVRQALRTADLTLKAGTNLADKDAITTGYVSNTGILVNSQDWKRVAINVKEIPSGTQLTFGGFHLGRTGYYAFYGSGSKISNGSYADPNGSTAPVTVTVPPGTDTLYVTLFQDGKSTTPEGWMTPYDELTCSIGTMLQPFAPYVKVVTAIKGYALAGTSQGSGGGGDIVADLPLAPDGAGIETGYAYIDSITGTIKVKLS